MTPKKKDEAAVEVQPDPAPASPPLQTEKLLKFRAVKFFSDGNLREAMEKYGYKVEWPTNEVRALPSWLIQRCMQSGAKLDRADG